jgi:hypothetical protein
MFEAANYGEAALWTAIAIGFLISALRQDAGRGASGHSCGPSWRSWVAALTFALFGLSDVVEAATGAWWRPWWLLAWKAACVVVLVGLYVDYLRRNRSRRWQPPSS